MSTAIIVSPYESMVADYLEEVEGYLCKTDIEFLKRSKGRTVRSDIDILAYKPKENRFLVCEVISYTPNSSADRAKVKEKIKTISSSDMKRFLKKYYEVDDYDKMLVTWTIPYWLKEYVDNSQIDIKLLSFRDIVQRSIGYLKERRGEKDDWVGVTNVTMLILQTVLHFKKRLKI